MKKPVGWIFLIIGILATIGGLTSTFKSDPGVELMGYIFKFALIVGGLLLITSKATDNSTTISADKPNRRISIYDITKMEGFSELPDEISRMNRPDY
jgi:hypothetical protein